MYDAAFPDRRPAGLRRRRVRAGTAWWRLDAGHPSTWEWSGFARPRHRFDPATGAFRTRYAARSAHGAARERYLDTGWYVPADHAGHHLVRLVATRSLAVLDLRTEVNLDALGVDDRISTSHEPSVWEAAHRLVEAARGWWPDLDGVVYRSRTTPATSANLAFFSAEGFVIEARPLVECAEVLDDLVVRHRFTVGFTW
ncbi:MAG: hypothetical protein R2726_17150 [Acidimicrobiales bacterium]